MPVSPRVLFSMTAPRLTCGNEQVVGSCSVAISAACHPPEDDVDAAYLAVSWGEVSSHEGEDVGHATFTSLEVRALEVGRLYAGKPESLLDLGGKPHSL